eukprot:GILK01002047.1.p1 GENE.GILK01002047.1~~GILK01002047.1.p1  ORF type:complete len:376 (-),score=51.72 GILK01002047.1:173-1300(-)
MDATESNICSSDGCGKPAKMHCPTCVKLGLPKSWFCAQDCFKANWNTHKAVHKLAAAPESSSVISDRHLAKFGGYRFTGPLRPHALGPRRVVPESVPKPDYAADGISRSELRDRGNSVPEINDAKSIQAMRETCRLGREVLDAAARAVRPGVTTDEIDRVVHDYCIEHGAYPSPLNYRNFPKSVCTSVNEVICHGIPDMRELEHGDIVNIDVTTFFKGHHGDLNETYFVGEVDAESKNLVKTAYESLMLAIDACRPGVMYRDLGNIITKHANQNGCSVVKSYTGHGVGRLFHTAPNIPHYSKNKAVGVMKPGHVFTIEPMINVGTWRDEIWPDDWTAVTADGQRSAQFEHTILITETGHEVLTARLESSPPLQWL